MKGLKRIWRPDFLTLALMAMASFAVSMAVVRPWVARLANGMENRNQSLRILFRLPLICSGALLSFAHGSNDVANAVGPLAAILHSSASGDIATKVDIPFWVMLIGAIGIAIGLFLYGPKLIKMVGEQITKMNPMRAFCVALSAAITVIIASSMGLPVSSTHIAVGAIFGVGFFREYYTRNSRRRRLYVQKHEINKSDQEKTSTASEAIAPRKLVRRSHFITIIAAWLITVPVAAILAAVLYQALSLIF